MCLLLPLLPQLLVLRGQGVLRASLPTLLAGAPSEALRRPSALRLRPPPSTPLSGSLHLLMLLLLQVRARSPRLLQAALEAP